MEVIFDFIFKITGRIPAVKEWFKTKKPLWAFLDEWHQTTKFPINPMDPNNTVRLYKRRGNIQIH
jgi:hypothetical protein